MYSISRLGSNAFSTTILTTSSSLSESLTSLVCFNAVTDALNAIQSGARLKNFWQLQSIAPCMHLGLLIYDHVCLLAFMTWFFFGRRSGRCCKIAAAPAPRSTYQPEWLNEWMVNLLLPNAYVKQDIGVRRLPVRRDVLVFELNSRNGMQSWQIDKKISVYYNLFCWTVLCTS